MIKQTTYTIGKLARAAGVHVETIRYYQRIRLLPVPIRQKGEARRYNLDTLRQLLFIRHARELGFALRAIASLMWAATAKGCKEALQEPGTVTNCHETRKLFTREAGRVEREIVELQGRLATLNALLAACRREDSASSCAIFDCVVKCEDGPSGRT
jgi:MerR family mercuric resistance operon transcriptional regulator